MAEHINPDGAAELRWQRESLERARREGERLARMYRSHDFAALRRRLLKRFSEVIGPEVRAIGFRGRIPSLPSAR